MTLNKGTDGFDYVPTTSHETFAFESTNGTMRCVNIPILEDDALEGNQNFTITWMSLDSEVTLVRTVSVVTIMDSDCTLSHYMKNFIE